MRTLVIGIFFTCFYHIVLTSSRDVLSLLDSNELQPMSVLSIKDHNLRAMKPEARNKSEMSARQILLQDIQQTMRKAQKKQFEEESDWQESIIGMWDWFVSGMRRVAKGMANLASQIMTS